MSWEIRIPHRFRDESFVDAASHARHLEGDDRAVTRQLVLNAAVDGMRTAGELLDHLDSLEPHERRALLDKARAEVGLVSTEMADARERIYASSRSTTSGIGGCAIDGCANVPVRHGIFHSPDVRRWHCPDHEHLAEPGDLEPRGSGLKLSPSGVPIDDDPVADARERERERSRRAQRQAQAEIRAVEAEEASRSRRLREAAQASELPEGLRPKAAA